MNNNDEELFKRWDELGARIDAKLFPYRWYFFWCAIALGIVAGIYL